MTLARLVARRRVRARRLPERRRDPDARPRTASRSSTTRSSSSSTRGASRSRSCCRLPGSAGGGRTSCRPPSRRCRRTGRRSRPRAEVAARGPRAHGCCGASASGCSVVRRTAAACSTRRQTSTTAGSNCVPGRLGEPAERLLDRQRLAVRAVGRHRVEGVAGEDDPRLERDLVGGEAVRVAQRRRSARGRPGRSA